MTGLNNIIKKNNLVFLPFSSDKGTNVGMYFAVWSVSNVLYNQMVLCDFDGRNEVGDFGD